DPRRWWTLIVLCLSLLIVFVGNSSLNVALPTLSAEFHASTASLEWVITGYLLSLAIWVPASGWIGDRFGNKRTFLFAVAAFVLSSGLCGLAWSIESLTVFRVLQGIGGGMMTPVGMAMLFRAFSVQERARASAVLTIPTSIAPMAGPLLGGFLVDQGNWRWIFFINLPIGIACFLFGLFALREHKEATAGKFDPFGFVLSGLGLAGVLAALSRGPDYGWTEPSVWVPGVVGVVCFALLVPVERRIAAPMLDLTLFKDRMFRVGVLTAFTANAALAGVLFLLPLYLQEVRGFTALESGLTTFPQTIGSLIMTQVTARTYTRLGPRSNMIIGTVGLAVTTGMMVLIGLETDLWPIRALLFVRGACNAFIFVSAQAAAYARIPREKIGRASSVYQTQRQVGNAVGVALLATVFVSRAPGPVIGVIAEAARPGTLAAWHEACLAGAIIALIGACFAVRIGRRDSFFAAHGHEMEGAPANAPQPALTSASR
ncbi:MAG: hypothetical protein QOF51_160, partial [Chloroflexota bacterium]|nr:hypothetical protein [Chloroflexota bacterium]